MPQMCDQTGTFLPASMLAIQPFSCHYRAALGTELGTAPVGDRKRFNPPHLVFEFSTVRVRRIPNEVKNRINVSKINMFRAIIILVGSCTMPATIQVFLKKIVFLFSSRSRLVPCQYTVHKPNRASHIPNQRPISPQFKIHCTYIVCSFKKSATY